MRRPGQLPSTTNMGTNNLILILAAEAFAFCLFVIALLVWKCRKLIASNRELAERLADSAQERVRPAKAEVPAPEQPLPPMTTEEEKLYVDYLDTQLEQTQDYHDQLEAPHDIVLDLDPDTPFSRRATALRYAFLLAEKEAVAEDPESVNWSALQARYRQLLDFHEDYQPPEASEELVKLQDALDEANQRIADLERYEALYDALEEKWGTCKSQADEHYAELRNLTEQSENKETLEKLLDNYRNSYRDLDELMGQDPLETPIPEQPADQVQELQRLRTVTADQHRIIQKLQGKLSSASSNEEKTTLINELQGELQKRVRYLQESETCVKLMEDELASANKQLHRLRNKASQVAELKMALQELRGSAETRMQVVDSLKSENRKLNLKLQKALKESPASNETEAGILRKELAVLQERYSSLEEKFLNSKMKE